VISTCVQHAAAELVAQECEISLAPEQVPSQTAPSPVGDEPAGAEAKRASATTPAAATK
jgi:hypothetical protein